MISRPAIVHGCTGTYAARDTYIHAHSLLVAVVNDWGNTLCSVLVWRRHIKLCKSDINVYSAGLVEAMGCHEFYNACALVAVHVCKGNKFKKGDKEGPDNYRGITLLSVVGKVFCKILNNRLVERLERERALREGQAGFRKSRSCMDDVYLNEIVQGRLREDKLTYAFFFQMYRKLTILCGGMACG